MALIGASLLMGSVEADLIYAYKSPEETVGICQNGNIFLCCVESVSDQVKGALGPSELTCTL